MQLFDRPPAAVAAGHAGYVAGRYRNGAYSDMWTDVRRCAERTFTAYAPGCSCGWRGVPVAATEVGYHLCCRTWLHEHAERLDGPHGPLDRPERTGAGVDGRLGTRR